MAGCSVAGEGGPGFVGPVRVPLIPLPLASGARPAQPVAIQLENDAAQPSARAAPHPDVHHTPDVEHPPRIAANATCVAVTTSCDACAATSMPMTSASRPSTLLHTVVRTAGALAQHMTPAPTSAAATDMTTTLMCCMAGCYQSRSNGSIVRTQCRCFLSSIRRRRRCRDSASPLGSRLKHARSTGSW